MQDITNMIQSLGFPIGLSMFLLYERAKRGEAEVINQQKMLSNQDVMMDKIKDLTALAMIAAVPLAKSPSSTRALIHLATL